MSTHSHSFCRSCGEDILRDCSEVHRTEERPCLVATLRKFAAAAEAAGFSMSDVIEMLNAGISVIEICDLIKARLTAEVTRGLARPPTN